jgi:phenylalanyl-tRNA synthetase beta chain
MPTITLEHSTLEQIQNINGVNHDLKIWNNWLPQIGCPVESNDQDTIEIEVFPDRPDLLSHETMARASRSFLQLSKENTHLDIIEGKLEISVDSDIKKVRPIIMSAIVKGVHTGSNLEEKEKFIQSLMDHQEKLHMTLGRKRKFASIGVHDLEAIVGPFSYNTVPSTFKFTPLAGEREMSISEILNTHPKGMEYSHLVEKLDSYPVILDSSNNVISFPPIINGEHTTVTQSTTDFFIDVTGWDNRACETCLILICLTLNERGGEIESLSINYSDEESIITPRGDAITHRVPDKLISKILGIDLTNEDINNSIMKMGGKLIDSRTVTDGPNISERWADCAIGEKEHLILMPRWRSDIMHPIDIVEDIAIGFGYENLPEETSAVHIDAIPLKSTQTNRRIRESLRALGLQETQSLTLSNERDQFQKMRWKSRGTMTNIANPISIDHTILRQYLLPSLMQLLAANRHQELPQRIYELGFIVSDLKNKNSFSWACAEVGGGFTAAKGYVQSIIRDLGIILNDVKFEKIEDLSGPWLYGRAAKVTIKGIEIGEFGELDPAVSLEFGLRSPIHAGEFDIEQIKKVSHDPLI